MRAGELRRRLTLEQPVDTSDRAGGDTRAFVSEGTVWGAVIALRAQELFQAQQIDSHVTSRVLIRYRAGVKPEWRITEPATGRVFEIRSVLDLDARRRQLELICEELRV